MTGLDILKQAYALLWQPENLATADGNEYGLMAVNQIYSELWHREHPAPFMPLSGLRQRVALSARFLPAMAYGTAMVLCLNGEADYTRYQRLYERAAQRAGGCCLRRRYALPREESV